MEGKEQSQWPRTTDNSSYYYVLAIVVLHALPPLISFPKSLPLSPKGPKLEQAPNSLGEGIQVAWTHIVCWGKPICFVPFITNNWQADIQEFVLRIYWAHKCAKYYTEMTKTGSLPSASIYAFRSEGFQGGIPEETFSWPIIYISLWSD